MFRTRTARKNTNPDEPDGWAGLARELFDDVLLPVSNDMGRNGASFLTSWRCPEAKSYLVQPHLTKMTPSDFEFPGGGSADGLIEKLGGYWVREGDLQLVPVTSRLKRIAVALEAEGVESRDGSVDIFCYTMF
jgi:hypothetical protein